jgi:hypothetical protein
MVAFAIYAKYLSSRSSGAFVAAPVVIAALFLMAALVARLPRPYGHGESDSGGGDADGGGWGRGPRRPRTPPDPPRGGFPLDDARPTRLRLRDHRRLG